MSSYDQVPYKSYPYVQSRPDRLRVVATLLGTKAELGRKFRVLELGACSGGNLIPIAEQLPEAEFVGIDASARQIADGNAIIRKLGLTNIQLLHRDIADIHVDFGQFDYILCHGVYSWVPRLVQDHILRICRENLSPDGVAYVSYNTHPGWRMRGIIRDVMLYRARGIESPTERVARAKGLVDVLAKAVPSEENAYGMLLRKELEMLQGKEDHYLFHEHLEQFNEPLYFHEFMDRAQSAGLQYLGEADFGVMSLRGASPQVAAVLDNVATNVLEREQYMDFIRNRMFRQTLLCHSEAKLSREITPDRIHGMYIASRARPEGPVTNLTSNEKVTFRGPSATTVTTDPLMKAALLYLGEIWPRSVAFTELLAIARSRLSGGAVVVDVNVGNSDAKRLGESMLRCYESSQVELSVWPALFTVEIAERPLASPLARLQAETDSLVTNRRHESVRLDDLQRHILKHLDGTNDRAALLDRLAVLAAENIITIHENERPTKDKSRIKEIMAEPLDRALREIAMKALLIGSN